MTDFDFMVLEVFRTVSRFDDINCPPTIVPMRKHTYIEAFATFVQLLTITT